MKFTDLELSCWFLFWGGKKFRVVFEFLLDLPKLEDPFHYDEIGFGPCEKTGCSPWIHCPEFRKASPGVGLGKVCSGYTDPVFVESTQCSRYFFLIQSFDDY
jgi:hypothetical protein